MGVTAQDAARVPMFETLYLYDMLDGGSYPLLADGPYTWDAGQTSVTVKIKASRSLERWHPGDRRRCGLYLGYQSQVLDQRW